MSLAVVPELDDTFTPAPQPPAIDPGEALLAVCGMIPVISRDVKRFTKLQLREVVALPKKLRRLARAMIRGSLEQPTVELRPYSWMLDNLSKPFNEDHLAQLMDTLPKIAQIAAPAFQHVAKKCFDGMQAALPRSTSTTFVGVRNLPPADPLYFRFLGVLSLMNEPLSVFAFMQCAMILKSQTDAFRLIYPTLSARIDYEIDEAKIDALSEKQSFQLPMNAEIGVRVWAGKPIMLPELQSTFIDAEKQAEIEKKKETASQETSLSKESLSSTQNALYGTLK